MSDSNLSAAVSQNLLYLNNTVVGIQSTSQRLSTGLKVNNPADNPGAYFVSQNLLAQKSTISGLQDGINQGAQTVQTAIDGLNSIRSILTQMQSIALQVSGINGSTASIMAQRGSLGATFDSLYSQVTQLANDTVYNGYALINGSGATLSVRFGTSSSSVFTIGAINATSSGAILNLPSNTTAAFGNATGDASAASAVNVVAQAITNVLSQVSSFSAQLGLIQARSSFTTSYTNDLQAGSDSLVKADLNEEGAKLLALQTLQSLGVNSINVAVGNTSSIVGLSTGFRGN